jgi:hypothetical protein
MGNSDSVIRNLDKRTVRREYRDTYIAAIKSFRRKSRTSESSREGAPNPVLTWEHNVRVAVRKRPIFQHEVDEHEFDVVTVLEGKNALLALVIIIYALITTLQFSFTKLQGGELLFTTPGYNPT